MSLTESLWWKDTPIVVPDSVDTKRLILQTMHDHPLAGHLSVTKTLKAISSRFLCKDAAQEVCDHMRHCPSCQLQTTHPSKPTALLQPLDVPPYPWHTITTDYITGLFEVSDLNYPATIISALTIQTAVKTNRQTFRKLASKYAMNSQSKQFFKLKRFPPSLIMSAVSARALATLQALAHK